MSEPQATTASIAEQIKARVRQADQERIGKRADAAAAVATKLAERDELSNRVAEVEAELANLVSRATTELMTEKELAEFVGVRPTDLSAKTSRRAPRKRRVAPPE